MGGVFSSFISSLTSSITTLRFLSQETSSQMHLVRQYLKQKRVSAPVVVRVKKYIEQAIEERQNRLKESDVPALKYLSQALWMDLRYDEFSPTLRLHPLFEALQSLDIHALKALTSALIFQECSVGDIIFSPGKA